MAASGLEVFDRTLQTTNIWLDEIMERIGPDRHAAWHVLGAVLHVLRDRLPLELAVHLGAQLPLLVRGSYYDQWHLGVAPTRERTVDDFLDRVAEALRGMRPIDPEDAARAVFRTLAHRLDPGLVAKVTEALPRPIRALWGVPA